MKTNKLLKNLLLVTVLATSNVAVKAQLPYQDQTRSFHDRAVDLVSRLTLAEKAQQMGNNVNTEVNRDGINLPMYQYWNEALHGVARSGAATSFPESKGMSATWDRQLIFDCATAISDEARVYHNLYNKGLNYWCPTINMSRDPRWGRDEENYGEDPFLAGQLAIQFIKGMQGNDPKYLKTVACAKHFAANNYEQGRQGSTSYMTKHNLREYYLPAFEMSVKEGKVKSIMSSYNALSTNVNETNAAGLSWAAGNTGGKAWGGKPNAMNDWLLNDILRHEWGYDGYVTSDCAGVSCIYRNVKHFYYGNLYGTYNESDATLMEELQARATADAIKAGNDMNCEFMNSTSVFQTAVEAAISKGYMTEADLDRALIRVFETRFALGEFDTSTPWDSYGSEKLESEANQALALKAAQESIVLLKNEIPEGGNAPLLPISTEKKIAIIGPYANQIMLGDYSGTPTYTTTPFQAIAAKKKFSYNDGTIQAESFTSKSTGANGVDANYPGELANTAPDKWFCYKDVDFGSTPCANFIMACAAKSAGVATVNFILDSADGTPFLSVSNVDNDNWHSMTTVTATIEEANRPSGVHDLYVKFTGTQSYAGNYDYFRFYNEGVEPLETLGPVYMVQTSNAVNTEASADMIARAVAVARLADVVVFCGGTDYSKPDNHATGTESHDRWLLTMPGNQTALLQAVYNVNKNVVLVLETNSSMDITWEKANLPAIIEAWYGGQAQGQAICDVLYGDYNPSGKLTSTWYNSLSELPSASDSQFGANGMLEYNIDDWGYTYMYYKKGTGANVSRQASTPMYPFGYGLSYTTFDYSNASISSTEARCTVTNSGSRDGAEVVQVYVSFPNSSVPHMQKLNRRLVGFERVELAAGESKDVVIPINKKQLAYWNDDTDELWVEGGTVNVYISASSADDRLTGSFVATAEMLEEAYVPDEPLTGTLIPTTTGNYMNWSTATLGDCSSENSGANIGSTHNGSTATFAISNTKKQDFLLTFLSGASGLTANVSFTISNEKGYSQTKQFDCSNTSNWTPSESHSALFTNVPKGNLTLTFRVESTTGNYAGNYGNLALRTVETVPGGIDLYSGSYSNCNITSNGTVENLKASGSTATYNFNVTKAGAYKFSWGVRKNVGGTVNIKVYEFGTTTVELDKDITIADGDDSYPVSEETLGNLTTGMKTIVLSFTSATDKWPCNYKDLALRYTGEDLNYYSFNLNVEGAPASLITINAVPAANEQGKYEEGTLITLKAVDNTLFSFQQWSDETTATTKNIKIKADTEETATYEELGSYLAGWDFSKGYNANADYAKREENETASLYLVNTDGTTASESYWNKGGYAQIWRTGELDYVARMSARNYKNITVQSKLNYNYNVWPTTKLQYSMDGSTWTDIDGASLTFTQSGWQLLNATLPEACNHAEKLYLRWASVREGDLIGSASGYRALQISDIYVLGDYEAYQDPVVPTVTYTTPQANSQMAKREGIIILNFDRNVKLDGQATLNSQQNSQQLTGEVFGSRITFPYSGLASNTEYTFTLPAGTVKNENDVPTASDITLTFTTVARATPTSKHAFDFVVGTDGTADEAIAAANASSADRFYIFVPNGEWELQGNTNEDGKKTNVSKTVSVIGQSRDGAVLFNHDDSENGWGISNTSTLNLQGEHSYLQDVTLKNWRGQGNTAAGVAVALSETGYNIYKNVHIWSNQDTYVSGGTNYWEGGRISGSVDYICGGGNIWFESTELMNTRAGSVITAPNTATETTWGYIFNNCAIGSYYTESNVPTGASVCENGGYTFGRPWQNAPRTTMLNTICNVLPEDAGWSGMGTNLAFHFNEFGSVSKNGMLVDLSGRNVAGLDQTNNDCDTNPVLSQEEASTFTLDAVMGTFTPTAYTEQCQAPVVNLAGFLLTWDDDPYALNYVIFKDGVYVANTTANQYAASADGVYTVRAANAMGGLSEASNEVQKTGGQGNRVYVVYPLDDNTTVTSNVHGFLSASGETLSNIAINSKRNDVTWPEGSGISGYARTYRVSDAWAESEVDASSGHYLQWAMQVNDNVSPVIVDNISLNVSGSGNNAMKVKVYYSTDPTFAQATLMGHLTNMPDKTGYKVTAETAIAIQPNQTLYVRIYPYRSSGKGGDIVVRDVSFYGWTQDYVPEYRTMAQWDFRTKTSYDVTDGVETTKYYTPNNESLGADITANWDVINPVIYPATYYGNQNNYKMTSYSPSTHDSNKAWTISKSGGYYQYMTYNTSNTSFTDPAGMKNYFQFQFSTKGYNNVEMEWSEKCSRNDTNKAWAVHVAYSTDGGTEWTDLDEQSLINNDWKTLTATVPGGHENMIVRILPTLDWHYQLQYLTLKGEIYTDVHIISGSLEQNGNSITASPSIANAGDEVTLNITTADTYTLTKILANQGVTLNAVENHPEQRSFTMPDADVTINATWDLTDNIDETKEITESVAVDETNGTAEITSVEVGENTTTIEISGTVGTNDTPVTSIAAGTFTAKNTANVQSIDLSQTQVDLDMARDDASSPVKDVPANTLIYLPAGSSMTGDNVIIYDGSGTEASDYNCTNFVMDGSNDTGKSYSVPKPFTATSTTLNREFTENVASTVCLPYALTQDQANALGKFYYFSSVTGNTVSMTQVASGGLESNKPYMFLPNATVGSNNSITATNVEVSIANSQTSSETGSSAFTFQGVIADKTFTSNEIAGGIYGFAAEADHGASSVGQFVKCSNGAYVKAFRAYLACATELTGEQHATSRGTESSALPEILNVVLVNADGSTTSIGKLELIDVDDDNSPRYNLSGQRVDKSYKGVVIINGKKVFIK